MVMVQKIQMVQMILSEQLMMKNVMMETSIQETDVVLAVRWSIVEMDIVIVMVQTMMV